MYLRITQTLVRGLIVLITALFYTLFERKLLRRAHIRVGPRLVGPRGLLQPFSDVLKLLSKAQTKLLTRNWAIYRVSPGLFVGTTLLLIRLISWSRGFIRYRQLALALIAFRALGLGPLLGASWASNSPWARLGAARVLAQTISYEVIAAFVLISILLIRGEAKRDLRGPIGLWAGLWVLSGVWVFCAICESNRAPFDFGEAESELVRGVNLEYGAGLFAGLFAGEYGRILFLRIFTGRILTGCSWPGIGARVTIILLYLFVWLRATAPRTRYDKLIELGWLTALPLALVVLSSSVSWVYRIMFPRRPVIAFILSPFTPGSSRLN